MWCMSKKIQAQSFYNVMGRDQTPSVPNISIVGTFISQIELTMEMCQ